MGLITTAIMSGAGVYAVNRLAKTAENRRENPSPTRYDYGSYRYQSHEGPDPRGYIYSPLPGQFQNNGQQRCDCRGPHQQQGNPPRLLENQGSAAPPWTNSSHPENMYPANNRVTAPPGYTPALSYYQAPQNRPYAGAAHRQTGFIDSKEASESEFDHNQLGHSRHGSTASLNALAEQSMGGGDKTEGKGKDIMKIFK